MRWDDFRASTNIEDRRGGGGFGIPGGGGGLGIGAVILLTLVGWVLGIDPRVLISGAEQIAGGGSGYEQVQRPQGQAQRGPQGQQAPPEDEAGRFAAKILGNTEDVWKQVLPAQVNQQYRPPRMVLFSGGTRSGCGSASSAMGPFYCPLDRTVYIDLSFFNDMQKRFRAGGDFAYAYVIAHEVGHHIENELGILGKVQQRQREVGQVEANQLSVRVELMADCLAGVWAHHSEQRYKALEPGDVEEAMRAAEAIGDDRLQKQSGGRVVPDSFTHGSSEQRMRWFMTGLKGGQVQACDTFRATRL
jgi:predicted metalloprotease